MNKLKYISCPRCNEIRPIPLYWALGIEGIFYCKGCRRSFKIDYRLGALLTGLSWALALGTVQLIAFFTSAFSVTLAVVMFLPLALFYSFLFRRMLLIVRCRMKKAK